MCFSSLILERSEEMPYLIRGGEKKEEEEEEVEERE